MPETLVLDLGTPRQRLLGWFLADNDIAVERVETLDEAIVRCHQGGVRAIVLNSDLPSEEARLVMAKLRDHCPQVSLFYLDDGAGPKTELDDQAHARGTHDVDQLVAWLREVLTR